MLRLSVNFVRIPTVARLAALLMGALPAALHGQSHQMDQAAEGLREAGSPLFAVLSKEALGLKSPPTDLHFLPDGRALVVAGQQLAFGDGVRWQVFNQAADDPVSRALTVAVDGNGDIYEAIAGGFAQVVFGIDGRWRLRKVAAWPATEAADRPVPRNAIMTSSRWFWHSSSGSIISWRPGETAVSVAQADDLEQIFKFHDDYFLSERSISDGAIIRIDPADRLTQQPRKQIVPYGLITSAAPYQGKLLLLGTSVNGVQIFDGTSSRSLVPDGVLAGGQRINDLCVVGGGYYAAAIENYGLVFFDEQGRIIQHLNREIDNRFGRINQLIASPGGSLWGLLNDGVFQVEFPSRVSYFESIISTGLASAHPRRVNGKLWVSADNQLLKAVYDASGRLTRFEQDSPRGQVVFTMSGIAGSIPIGSTTHGAFYQNERGWQRFADDTSGLRVLRNQPFNGRWLYSARDEIGWLSVTPNGPHTTGQVQPGLGDVFNANSDGQDNIWLERGTGRLGRVQPNGHGPGQPSLELFGEADGVPHGWAQVFIVDGVARFNVGDQIMRFDEATRRFVPDPEFIRDFAGLGTIVGRPGRDAFGRLWVTTEIGIYLFEGKLGHLKRVMEPMPTGFQPYYFTFETGGVVWLHSARRFARYDPSFPAAASVPLRALITHITLPSTGHTLYPAGNTIPDLSYHDNSLIPHFISNGAPLTASVTFDVRLEGSGQDWVSSGSAGSAVFNRLTEGKYTLQVRPSSMGTPGEITSIAFTINPPWYRTIPAYAAGIIVLLGTVFGLAWLFTFLQRREKLRLENLVAQRTRELHESNVQLASQIDEIRTLSQAIQQSPVGVLIIQRDGTIVFANPRVCELSGYTLAELLGQPFRLLRQPDPHDQTVITEFNDARQRGDSWQGELTNRSKSGRNFHVRVTASPLRNTKDEIPHYLLLEEDITDSLAEQEHHRRLEAQLFLAQKRESLGTLAGGIAHDFNNILTGILGYNELIQLELGENSKVASELSAIRSAGQRAKELVSQILTYTRKSNVQLTPLDLSRPVAEALKLIRASTPATIEINQSLQSGIVRADPSQIHQVMLNLCTNAAHAMKHGPGRMEVRLELVTLNQAQAAEIPGLQTGRHMRLTVTDTGAGMDQATLDRIFDPFFTTKQPGEGTGLGLSIVQGIMASHKGALQVRSTPGVGSTFELYFPVTQEARTTTAPPLPIPQGGEQEIIVIDDEPMVTSYVSARLKLLGYRPCALNDPRAALDLIEQNPRRFDAMITDLTMPHMTGVELIRRLHEQQIDLPTLIITGYNLNAERADLASLPKCLVLNKPFTGEELAQALRRAMSNGQNSHPATPPTASASGT